MAGCERHIRNGTACDRKAGRRRAVLLFTGIVIAVPVAVQLLTAGAGGGAAWLLTVWLILAALALADPLLRPRDGVPVLTWHSVSRKAGWNPWAENITVQPETLDRQLALLRRKGFRAMDSRAFVEHRRRGEDLPADTVVLHFDDGYLDNWIAAAPLLAHHGMVATLFVSLDFVAPDRPLSGCLVAPSGTRSPAEAAYAGPWDGYLSWREIEALDKGAFGGVFDVQPHGVDHGRVPVSDRVEDRLTPHNWRRLAWVQWAHMPGDKHDWYRAEIPPKRPLGTPVPESDGALAARAWLSKGALESQAAYEARVRRDLSLCRRAFRDRLSKTPKIFCWPQNRSSAAARRVAAELGYAATTGGRGRNARSEPADTISRLHVGERYAGFDSARIDDLAFYASVRCFQGNHYWYPVLIAVRLIKLAHARLRPRGGRARLPREVRA